MPKLTDVEWIFVILALYYAIGLLAWVRPGVTAFTTRWGSFRGRRPAFRLIGNDNGSLLVGGLTPSDAFLLVAPMTIWMGKSGVVSQVLDPTVCKDRLKGAFQHVAWDALRDCHADATDVRADGCVIGRMDSRGAASRMAAALQRIAAVDDADRDEAIDAVFAESFDVDAVRARVDQWRGNSLGIRYGAWLLLGWIAPLGLILHYDRFPMAITDAITTWYLVLLFVIWWVVALLGYRAHRKLHPEDKSGRWKLLFYSLVSPVVPLRAADYLARGLLFCAHPITVSAAIDTKDVFRENAAALLRDHHHPIGVSEIANASNVCKQVLRESDERTALSLRHVTSMCDIDADDLLTEPEPEDENSLSYCPRCLQQFEIADAKCEQCGGRSTLTFQTSPRIEGRTSDS